MTEIEIPQDLPQIPEGKPLLIVLSGVSGAGKDAVRDMLMAWRLPAHFVVTATTRPMRPGEIAGRDYIFVDDAEFDRLEEEDALIEHAIVYGQRKGVPRDEVLKPLDAGEDVLARVDVQGAETLRKLAPDALLVFITPPSLEELEKRLVGRDTDSSGDLRLRLQTASSEMEAAKHFDYVVVNETDQLEATVRRVFEIIATEKARRAAR